MPDCFPSVRPFRFLTTDSVTDWPTIRPPGLVSLIADDNNNVDDEFPDKNKCVRKFTASAWSWNFWWWSLFDSRLNRQQPWGDLWHRAVRAHRETFPRTVAVAGSSSPTGLSFRYDWWPFMANFGFKIVARKVWAEFAAREKCAYLACVVNVASNPLKNQQPIRMALDFESAWLAHLIGFEATLL